MDAILAWAPPTKLLGYHYVLVEIPKVYCIQKWNFEVVVIGLTYSKLQNNMEKEGESTLIYLWENVMVVGLIYSGVNNKYMQITQTQDTKVFFMVVMATTYQQS